MGNSDKRGAHTFARSKNAAKAATALLLSTASCIGVAAAQTPPAAPVAQSDDEIVVTARRREELAQSVPAAITAVSSETIEEMRLSNVEDLQRLEPTLSVSGSSGRPNSPVYSLRGIRPTESVYGQDPTVAIYVADVVQSPAQGSNLGMWDLENIQVLKGPQGTLFGRNTVGGAILLTPRGPGDTFGGDIMVGAGTYDLVETQFGLDVPLSDAFRVRLAGRLIDSEGYQTNVAPGPYFGTHLGGEQTQSGRITAEWDVTSHIQNTTILSYDNKETNGRGTTPQAANRANASMRCYDGPGHPFSATPGVPCAAPNPDATSPLPSYFDEVTAARARDVTDVSSDLLQYDNVSAWSITNTTTVDLNENLTFKAIAAYREVETDTLMDLDASRIPNILTTAQTAELNHGSLELQLLGTAFGGRLDWVTGAYYYTEEGFENSPGGFFRSLIIQRGTVENSSYSVFAQGTYALTDQLNVTAGARLTRDERSLDLFQTLNGNCRLRVQGPGTTLVALPNSACGISLSDEFEQPTGTLSVDYQVTPDVMLYATTRLGYRSGGFNMRATQPVEYAPFDPETVIDFEAGIKSDWELGGMRMRTNIAAFHQQYDDIQRTIAVPVSGGTPGSVVVNAAAATTTGVELQQTIRPTDNLTFQINYAYNNPEYDEWIDNGVDVSGTPFPFTPESSGSIMVNYEREMGQLGTLNLTANYAYTGDHWINALHTQAIINAHPANILPLLQQEAYWLLDLSASVEDIGGSPVDLNLYVRNATDEEYKVGGIQLYTGASGFIAAAYGPPRSFGAQLRYQF